MGYRKAETILPPEVVALIQQYGGELTDYGLLTRADKQPVQKPLPPQQKLGGMEMR